MARRTQKRAVQCYLCRHRFEVPARAESTSCPGCNKAVIVGDIVVKRLRGPLKELRTCGHVKVVGRGRLIAGLVEAHRGITCDGIIDAEDILSGGLVEVGKKAKLEGRVTAPAMEVKKGASISSKQVSVPLDPLEIVEFIREADRKE